MKYNFDEVIDRSGTDTIKWSKARLKESFSNEECIPMWIADMDFKTAQPIIDAIIQRAQHGIFGYGHKSDAFRQAVVDWQEKRNDWKIQKDWLLFTPGIIPALSFIVETVCRPGDKVIVQNPVYYPFYNIIQGNGCQVVHNQLIERNGRYEMDYAQLSQLAKDSRTKMLILCSPHNPVGRVWTEDELTKLAEICKENNVLVVSDEIHSDLIFKPNRHIPFGKIAEKLQMKTIVCTSPSKTFNLAGLQTSNIIVPDDSLRTELEHKLEVIDIDPGTFASVAQIAAYGEGEEWLEQLLEYLQGNLQYMEEFVQTYLPKLRLIKPEGTYLAWLDFSQYGFSVEELQQLMQQKAQLALDDGFIFGAGGEPFQRINFACPRSILEQAMGNIRQSVENL